MHNAQPTSDGPEAGGETKPRLLIVDDVADNRAVLTRRLVRRGFEIVEASGGRDALEKVAAESFDLVLLDIMMPDINGNDVLKAIRETYSDVELPVVMVTAKGLSENVAESIELGANDYITKPVDFTVALARIKSLLQRKARSDAMRSQKTEAESKAAELMTSMTAGAEELQAESNRRQLSEDRLRYLAYHDEMTGLLNRQGFKNALTDALSAQVPDGHETALLVFDLNGFKQINDTYGHAVGDKVLIVVAERLKDVLGSDLPAARLGGDEFAIVLSGADQPATSLSVSERIIEAINLPFEIDGHRLEVGLSCGVARASDCRNDPESLIKSADLAMYHAKETSATEGIVYTPAMLEAQERRRKMENDLRLALKTGGLELYYQPLVDMISRKIIAFEALVRWQHPEFGLLPPDKFIPLAEEIGVIDQLGNWVLREACHQAATWPSHISVAVNVSPLQFKEASVLPVLTQALAASGLSPTRLELEITEGTLLNVSDTIMRTLDSIRELGVKIAMDDFGTGYSSLGYLEKLRFDKIKIDKKFIQNLSESGDTSAIVSAIINLSRSIGAQTTAEGIETEEQYDMILLEGCNQGQGYLFSRPVTADDAAKLALNTVDHLGTTVDRVA